jgi:hypothetical protein
MTIEDGLGMLFFGMAAILIGAIIAYYIINNLDE